LNNYDLIVDCTDKLLDQWRSKSDNDPGYVHLNVVDQCQNLSLAIFGFLAFDYDLQTLDEANINKKNRLTEALNNFLEIFLETTRAPNFLAKIILKFHSRYQRAKTTIDECLNKIMEQEQSKTPEQIAEQKRTSLIASLITSLQQDENAEAAKPEREKKGELILIVFSINFHFIVIRFISCRSDRRVTSVSCGWFGNNRQFSCLVHLFYE